MALEGGGAMLFRFNIPQMYLSAPFFFFKHLIKLSFFCSSIRPYVRTSVCPPVLPSTHLLKDWKGQERAGKDKKGKEVRGKCWKEVERQAIQKLASPSYAGRHV